MEGSCAVSSCSLPEALLPRGRARGTIVSPPPPARLRGPCATDTRTSACASPRAHVRIRVRHHAPPSHHIRITVILIICREVHNSSNHKVRCVCNLTRGVR